MTVEEYSNKVQELLKNANGYISGIKLSKDSKVKMNIEIVNGNPALILSEVNDNHEPTKIVYCMELADMDTVRAMQIWIGDALGIIAHTELQKANVNTIENNTTNKE